MRTSLLTGLLLVLVALAGAAPARAVAADRVGLAARLATCTTGADDASRAAAFTGSMPAAGGSRRLLMRFTLLQRVGPGPKGLFKKLSVPGWGGWEKSDPGRQAFVFTKRVEALTAPAGYRAAITFRWLDARGRAQRTTTRTTPVCEQPDPRPDLVLGAFDVTALNATSSVYTVSVDNEGHSDADPFAVTVTVGDATTDPVTLGPLAAGARATQAIAAPRCTPGQMVTVTLDAADAVDESDEADDVVQRPCPLA